MRINDLRFNFTSSDRNYSQFLGIFLFPFNCMDVGIEGRIVSDDASIYQNFILDHLRIEINRCCS